MNLVVSEVKTVMIAKSCGSKERGKRVSYAFNQSYHDLCMDKKEILIAEFEACERLLNYTTDADDKEILQKELAELRQVLDLMP